MKEKRGNFTPLKSLSLADDLKALAYTTVAISPGGGDIGVAFVTDAALRVLRGWRKVFWLLTHWSTPDRFWGR